MRKKIKEALKQKYGTRANKELGQLQLGLSDEVFERVAASIETFITDENMIDGFVQSENTLNLLKSFQSEIDKARAKNEPPKNSESGEQPESKPQSAGIDQESLAKMIAEAVAVANKPFIDEIAAMKAEKAVNDTIATVNSRIDTWGYGKGYPKEMAKARKNAMELYEAYGKKWNADELEAKIKEKFNMEVEGKGLDTTQPFQSGGGNPDPKDSNKAFAAEIRKALGMKEE